jgi:hypothetical protein
MYAGNIPDGLKMKGPLEIKVESSGTQKKFNVAVNADMKAMEIQYKDMFNKSAQIPLSLTCKGGKEAAQLSFQEFKLVLNNLVMTAPEEISINTEKPQFNVITETRVDSLAGWDALVPMLSSYHLEGGLLLKSSLSGTPEDTSFDMRLTSNRVGFHLPNPGEKKESTDPRPGIVEGISVHVQGNKKADKINGKCKLNVEKGEVLSVPFRKLLTNLNYTPDQLKIASLDIQAFQGGIHGSGHYKLKQGDWSFQPDLKGIAVGEALDKFTEYKDAFSGSFSGSFQIEGSTKAEEKGPKHVKGTFNLSQGELKNFNLTDRVLEALFGLKGLSQFLAQERGGTDKHNTTQFDSLKGDLEMKGKNLHFETLELHNIRTAKATDSIAMFKGDCSMESKSLDLKGKLILSKRHSQELAQKASVLEALLDQEKRMVLPVTIKGPIKKPIPVLDEEYVLDALTGYYTKKAVDKGLDKLKEKIRLPGGAEGLEKPVEKILRGLFGK